MHFWFQDHKCHRFGTFLALLPFLSVLSLNSSQLCVWSSVSVLKSPSLSLLCLWLQSMPFFSACLYCMNCIESFLVSIIIIMFYLYFVCILFTMGYDFILTHLSGPIICCWCFWLQNFAGGAQLALLCLPFSQGPCSFSSCTHDQQPFTCGSSLLIQIVGSCPALWPLLKSLSWCLWRMPANKQGRSDRKKNYQWLLTTTG